MSNYSFPTSSFRPLPQVPLAHANDGVTGQLRERGRPAWDETEGSITPKDPLDIDPMQAYPMQPLYGREPHSLFSAAAGDDSGRSINGFDDDTQQFTGLGALTSVGTTGARARGPRAPVFQDNTRGGPAHVEESLAVPPKRRSRACLWVVAGVVASVAAVATGLGVHFAMGHSSTAATSGSAAGAAVGSSTTSVVSTTASGSAVNSLPLSTTTSFIAAASSVISSSVISSSSVLSSSILTASSSTSPTPTSSSSSSSSSSPVVSPSTPAAAGLLQNGVFNVDYVKQTDACATMDLICNAQITETWTISTTGSTYNLYTSREKVTTNVGAPTTSNVLSFGLPSLTALEANNCTYSVNYGFSLDVLAETFTGISTWRRNLINECTDNKGRLLPAGDSCDCQYTLSGSVVA